MQEIQDLGKERQINEENLEAWRENQTTTHWLSRNSSKLIEGSFFTVVDKGLKNCGCHWVATKGSGCHWGWHDHATSWHEHGVSYSP